MATNTQGILGAFRGKVGTVIGCQLGDTFYIRSLPRKRSRPAGAKELANQAAFALVQNWLSPLKPVLQTGFKVWPGKVNGYRAALGYNRKQVVAGQYPDLSVDIHKVKLSMGDLPGALNAAVAVAGVGELRFSWSYDEHDLANPYDQVMIVAYNTTRSEAVYKTTGNFRKDGEDILRLPDFPTSDLVHCWLSFIAADRGMQSESVYLGVVGW